MRVLDGIFGLPYLNSMANTHYVRGTIEPLIPSKAILPYHSSVPIYL